MTRGIENIGDPACLVVPAWLVVVLLLIGCRGLSRSLERAAVLKRVAVLKRAEVPKRVAVLRRVGILKRAAILLCLIVAPCSMAQSWELVARSSDLDEFHVDRSTVLRENELRRVWMLASYTEPIRPGALSLRFLVEYRCDAQEWRTVEVLEASGTMGSGELRRQNGGFGDWRAVDPESPIEMVMREVCTE